MYCWHCKMYWWHCKVYCRNCKACCWHYKAFCLHYKAYCCHYKAYCWHHKPHCRQYKATHPTRNGSIPCQVYFTLSATDNDREARGSIREGYHCNNKFYWECLCARPDLPVRNRALVETIQSISVTKEKSIKVNCDKFLLFAPTSVPYGTE